MIPLAVIRLAALRAPAAVRDMLREEWIAEAVEIRRVVGMLRALRFALGLLRTGRSIGRTLAGPVSRSAPPERLAAMALMASYSESERVRWTYLSTCAGQLK
jgi:hypothetical protein